MSNFNRLMWVNAAIVSAFLFGCGGQESKPNSMPGIRLLAGTLGGPGNIDGIPGRFRSPRRVAVDGLNNVYVIDQSPTIRKISSTGEVSTIAGAESAGEAMAVDGAGTIYLPDPKASTIRKITSAGVVTTLTITPGAGSDASALFFCSTGMALDNAGSIYVADNCNRLIRKITPSGVMTTLAGNRLAQSSVARDGLGSEASFSQLYGIAVDSSGAVYVIDTMAVRKITAAGLVTTIAGELGAGADTESSVDGIGPAARFSFPTGIAVNANGTLYITEAGSNQMIRQITPGGMVTTLAGIRHTHGYADGTGPAAIFDSPRDIAVNLKTGILYVADANNHVIRSITPAGVVSTLAGKAAAPGAMDGIGAEAKFSGAPSVAVDEVGNVYVADTGNHLIRKITPDHAVTTLAGVAGITGSVDGKASNARFNSPSGVAVDGMGNVYVADTENHTIRTITSSGIVSTLAGISGVSGFADGAAAVATFNKPRGVAVDVSGNVYVADMGSHRIRKISASGVVTTIAGGMPNFAYPNSVAVDRSGNVYVVGLAYGGVNLGNPFIPNNAIHKISPSGADTIIAGGGEMGTTDGPASVARFSTLSSVAVDPLGNVYVTDKGNNTVRKIGQDGSVTTIAGRIGSEGVLLGDLPGSLSRPLGIAVDNQGAVYTISENSVLKIQF